MPHAGSSGGAAFLQVLMRYNRSQLNSYEPPRVERIELSDKDKRKRWIAVILLLAVGLAAFGIGISSALSRKAGWTEIEPLSGSSGSASEFSFRYYIGEKHSRAEYRTLSALYTTACERASKVYSSSHEDGIGNFFTLNFHPDEEVTLEPELYSALERIKASGNRIIYLAPLYETYGSLFFCEDDSETAEYDPLQNAEVAEYFEKLASFACDPDQIDIELLGGDRAVLRVSEEYLRYAEENALETLVDIGWMKNAFIIDDLASELRKNGFTRGYLQSRDGFGVNMDSECGPYTMIVLDGTPEGAAAVAEIRYDGPRSFIDLHSYALQPAEGDWYYETDGGEVRSVFVDPADGMPKTSADDLLLWSGELGCGEIILRTAPVFIADSFDPSPLGAPLYYAYCEGKNVVCSDPDAVFTAVADGYELRIAGR